MPNYRLKVVSAEQFLVESLPWPEGVSADDGHSLTGYLFSPQSGAKYPIAPGDYIVTTLDGRVPCGRAEFEFLYEPTV